MRFRIGPGGGADRSHDLVQPHVLRQAGDGTGLLKRLCLQEARRGGQADDGDRRTRLTQRSGRLHAVQAGKAEIHDDDVQVVLPAERDDVIAVLGGRDDLDVGLDSQQQLERLAKDAVVLDEGDPDGPAQSAFWTLPALRQRVQT